MEANGSVVNMPHAVSPIRKNLLIGTVGSVVRFKLRDGGRMLLQIRDELEGHLERNQDLKAAPFKTVSLLLRYGPHDEWEPVDKYKIDRHYDELHVAVQLAAVRLKQLEADPERLLQALRSTVIEALKDVAANYDLPHAFLDDVLTNSGA